MTQEDRDLLVKDLCSRLPYGVKIQYEGDIFTIDHISAAYEEVKLDTPNNYTIDVLEVKPYLFPLSSMTLEQRCKVQNLLPKNCNISFKNQKITFYDEGNVQLEQLEKIFNFFNLHHFDYRGLIEKGLAIEAPEGMYN